MNYSKGNWQILPVLVELPYMDERMQHYYIIGEINGNPDRTIADIGCWKDRENALDDARLIAAAPDMYEALIKARGIIASIKGEEEAFVVIQNALAKAEGK